MEREIASGRRASENQKRNHFIDETLFRNSVDWHVRQWFLDGEWNQMIGNRLMGCLLSNPTYNQNTINIYSRPNACVVVCEMLKMLFKVAYSLESF